MPLRNPKFPFRLFLQHFVRHLHHAAHTTHTTHAAHGAGGALLLGGLNDGDLGGTEQRGNAASISETSADNLEGVEDTSLDHVDVLALGAVETLVEVVGKLVLELTDNDGALHAGVLNDGPGWAGDGVLDDADAELLIEIVGLDVLQGMGRGLDQSSTAAGQDTLLDSSASSVQSINEAVLLLTDLDLRGAADLDNGNTTRELGKTLLELLLLVVRGGGVSHDATDLLAALGNRVLGAITVQDNGVLLGDGDGTGGAEELGSGLLELEVELVSEDGSVGENGKIAKDGLAVVTEAGSLDSSNLKLATELVENADSKSLTVDVLSNDDKGTALLGGGLKSRDDVLDGRDLLLREEDERLLKLNLLGLGVGDEVGGDEATVETHTLGNLELIVHGLALLDGDNTLLANLLHGVGNQLADVGITVGTDSGDLGNLGAGSDIPLVGLEVLNNSIDSSLSATAKIHGVAASSYVLDGLREDGPGKDGGRSRTVTSGLVGLRSDILQ